MAPAQQLLVRSAVRQQAAGKEIVPMVGKDDHFEASDVWLAHSEGFTDPE